MCWSFFGTPGQACLPHITHKLYLQIQLNEVSGGAKVMKGAALMLNFKSSKLAYVVLVKCTIACA
jgi:hypothetical protein